MVNRLMRLSEIRIMGIFDTIKSLFDRQMVDSLSPDQMIEMLPTLELWSRAYPPKSKEAATLRTMDAVALRFSKLPVQVQREALIKGLQHKEDHVRRACAERLQYWENSPRVTMAMLEALDDPDRWVRYCAAMHLSSVGCCETGEQRSFFKSKLSNALSKETDANVRIFIESAIKAFTEEG
jgi:HEAT repeat protein